MYDHLKLNKQQELVYDTINYYDRYKELSRKYRLSKERMDKTDKKEIFSIMDKLGYSKIKYNAKERFYRISETTEEGFVFYFHTCIKYGLVELIFGVEKNIVPFNNDIIGGTASNVCKYIEITKDNITEGYIKKPAFSSYEELTDILKESFLLYEDLKKAVIRIYTK